MERAAWSCLGPAHIILKVPPPNTYAGTTTVDEDTTLLLGKPSNTKAVPGPLVIDSGATVRLLNSFQIYSASASGHDVRFQSAGSGWKRRMGWPISLQGAQITSGTGTLYFSGQHHRQRHHGGSVGY